MKNKLTVALFFAGMLMASQGMAQSKERTGTTATAAHGYTELNPGEKIIIYKFMHGSHSPKEADKYRPKYFFTLNSTDILQALTKANLKSAFPTNHPFHDALDANFKEDKELINYDQFHKMYKVNWLIKNNMEKS